MMAKQESISRKKVKIYCWEHRELLIIHKCLVSATSSRKWRDFRRQEGSDPKCPDIGSCRSVHVLESKSRFSSDTYLLQPRQLKVARFRLNTLIGKLNGRSLHFFCQKNWFLSITAILCPPLLLIWIQFRLVLATTTTGGVLVHCRVVIDSVPDIHRIPGCQLPWTLRKNGSWLSGNQNSQYDRRDLNNYRSVRSACQKDLYPCVDPDTCT